MVLHARAKAALFLSIVALTTGATQAAVYTDTNNDALFSASNPQLEITSVEVTNDAANVTFKVNLGGDPTTTSANWAKYFIGIDSVAGGISTGIPWGKTSIRMSSGMDFATASWADFGGGFELYGATGTTWTRLKENWQLPATAWTASSVAYTVPLADLNLTEGSTFAFDVYASDGGGGSAIDASAKSGQTVANWTDPYDSGSTVSTYTVQAVPEPASASVLGVLSLALMARRRK